LRKWRVDIHPGITKGEASDLMTAAMAGSWKHDPATAILLERVSCTGQNQGGVMNSNPCVAEIVDDWLRTHGYDGLFCGGGCACEVGDINPCGEAMANCQAGHKTECKGGEECPLDGDCAWHIGIKEGE